MAGTVTTVEYKSKPVKKIKWTWTASAGGAADGTTTNGFYGQVLAMVTIPDGTTAPTDNYDITIADGDGFDVMQGVGANRDTANTETAVPTTDSPVYGQLTLHVTNAGSGGKGVTILYVR